jgi:putative ABC transport system permease protein
LLNTPPFLAVFALAWRGIRTRRSRTLLTLLGIVLGVAVVLAIQVTNESTLASLRQVFDRAAGQANLLVLPAGGRSGETLDEGVLEQLSAERLVLAAAPSLQVFTVPSNQASSYRLDLTIDGVAAGSLLQVLGIDPEVDPQVRVYVLAKGRLPAAGRYEAAVPQRYAAEYQLEVGSRLEILTEQGPARLAITGILADEGVGLLNQGSLVVMPLDTAQDLFLRRGELDEVALLVEAGTAGDPRALQRLKESLEARLGREALVEYPAARGTLVPQMLATYQQGLAFFSVIAIFVGGFLIYNTFTMTVVERTRETGMLRTLGMSRGQVLRMVLAEAALLAAAGSALGVGAGLFLARGLIYLLGGVVSSDAGVLAVPAAGLAQALLVGLAVTFSAALLPAVQAARISPLEALRVRGRSTRPISSLVPLAGASMIAVGWIALYYVVWPEWILFYVGTFSVLLILLGATLTVPLAVRVLEGLTRPIAKAVYAGEGALGSANVQRAVGRTTLTVASLMVALTMVIGIGSLAYTFEEDITTWIDTALGGDLYVRSPLTMREGVGAQLAGVAGVEVVSPARYIDVRAAASYRQVLGGADSRLVFNAIEPGTFRQVGDVQFVAGQGEAEEIWRRFSQGGAVFITSQVAERYGVGQGDFLVLQTRRGEQPFYVAAEMVDFTGEGQVVIGTYADLRRWYSERGADRFTIKIAAGYTVEQVEENIAGRVRGVSTISTEVFKNSIRGLMRQSFRLFDVLNLIGVVIGVLGVINTLTMNVIERRREIGGLRSLGMTQAQVLRMVLAESLSMGLVGGIYGLVFGWLIAQVMILGVNVLSGYDLVYRFTGWPFAVGALIALVVSQAAALAPARRAARVNIIEAIKFE